MHSVFSPLVYDSQNKVTMSRHCKRGGPAYLVSKWQPRKKAHYLPLEQFEGWMFELLTDVDWAAVAGESESPEIKTARAQLDETLGEMLQRGVTVADHLNRSRCTRPGAEQRRRRKRRPQHVPAIDAY